MGNVDILEAVRKALSRGPCTLGELVRRVEELTGERVGPGRLKRILLRNRPEWLEVEIRTRVGRSSTNKCPVCGAKMVEVLGPTIEGVLAPVALRCPRCGFETPFHNRRTPAQYTFRLRPLPERTLS